MRDASGNLVEVRVREPWALHLLTADGTNAAAADDAETMKAPAEPGLVQLTPTGVEMLVERYVRWAVEKKNSQLLRRSARTVRRRLDAVFAERHSGREGDQHGAARLDVGSMSSMVSGSIATRGWFIGSIHSFGHACRPIRPPSRMSGMR